MAYTNGIATDYQDLFQSIRTHVEVDLPVLERWVVLEEVTTGIDRYTIWKAPGLDGTKEIYIGIRTYESIASDYYNYEIAGFTGYTPGNSWETHPGYNASCIPLWNGAIPYWIVANGQRLVLVANIESNYVSCHMGFMLPFLTPGQYPYPIAIGACLDGSRIGTRYSDTSYNNWWKGSDFAVRYTGIGWADSGMTAYAAGASTSRNTIHDSNIQVGYYGLRPFTIYHSTTIKGDVDGVFHISGFNNVTENTIVVDGITYIVFRDVFRTGFNDYMALKAT